MMRFCEQKALVHRGEKIGLAVSGGLDSVVLLDLFIKMRHDWQLHLLVLHFNHKLRPEAAGEADFVAQLCAGARIRFVSDEKDVASFAVKNKVSIEMAARECRYAFFDHAVARHHLDGIATAHTANDQAETVLAHIMRGTGLSGLGGIAVRRGHIIRPLLFAERAELQAWAANNDLRWCEDASNLDEKFSRNRIRHTLLPLMQQQFNPQIVKALNRLGDSAVDSELIVQQAALDAYRECVRAVDGKIVLDIDRFLTYLKSLQRLILWHVFEEVGKSPRKLSFHTLTNLLQFLQKRAGGASLQLDQDVTVVISGKRALFQCSGGQENHWIQIESRPGRYDLWHDLFLEIKATTRPLRLKSLEKESEYIDADLLAEPLVARSFQNADYFHPVNGAGRRKLSDYFIDQKIAFHDRRHIPILESDGAIVWVVGLRLDDRFRVTQNTKRVYKLTIAKRERKNDF
ncbi:tRNA lysidine(34) synthetase TilS [candidate division KSB1 bacterium]|nr:tRNA lysidine(34) synthetase TilS [candidate division KSB1 bacterium]